MTQILIGLGWFLIALGVAAFLSWLTLTAVTLAGASRISETPAWKLFWVSALYTLPIFAGAALVATS